MAKQCASITRVGDKVSPRRTNRLVAVEYVALASLSPDPRPQRKHGQRQLASLIGAIERFDVVRPILVTDDNVVLDGNAVLEAAKRLGHDTIPVIRIGGYTPNELRALQMSVNRLGEYAQWDEAVLRADFIALLADPDIEFSLDFTGFDQVFVDRVTLADDVGALQDEVPEPDGGAPVTQLGDVWLCGRHRIVCGDSRDGAVYVILLAGGRVRLTLTDPPYNVRIAGNVSGLGKVQHREFAMASGEMTRAEFVEFQRQVFDHCRHHSIDGALPPRNLKSEFASIVFPTWLLGRDPSRKIINITYSEALTKDFARGSKALMETADYKRMFPTTRINPRANADTDFTLMKHRGKRFGTTVFGPITGFGGDFLIIDDPIKPEDARSDTVRTRVNEWFESTALSRLDRKETGCIIVIMQRLHVDDLSGRLLEAGGWTHLNLPALATERQVLDAGLGLTWTREIGDPLNSRFESRETLAAIRESMGEDFFQSQYQQSPVMPGGNIVKLEWLQRYRVPFKATMNDEVVFSWDTAFGTGDNNDWSVGTVWVVRGGNYYLGDVVRGRFSGGDLVTTMVDLWNRYPTNRRVILLEKVNGMELVAEQVRQACPDVDMELVPPVQNKVSRLWASTPIFQRGAVHLPDHAPWLDEYVKELISFPRAKHDDQVDATSQFLGWITTKPDLTVVQRSW